MLYKCDDCNYCTQRLLDLQRHQNRKYKCNRRTKDVASNSKDTGFCGKSQHLVEVDQQNINITQQNTNADQQNINVDQQNINVEIRGNFLIDKTNRFVCKKCNKPFSSNQRLQGHIEKCDGLDPKQCRICLKVFTTFQGKHQHVKYVKCSSPLSSSQQPSITNIGTLNMDNSVNTYNINIQRHDFDKISNEDIQKIVAELERSDYIKMIRDNIDIGKYVIPRTMETIYFNERFPEMQTLKKKRRNDKMVDVHVGKGKWEKRMIDDIFRKLVGRVEDFHSDYFKFIEEKYKDVKIGSPKWKQLMRPIKTFGNMMLWYEGFIGSSIESLGIELNYPDECYDMEKERERRNREMEQLVAEKVYEETVVTDGQILEQIQRVI